MLRFDNYEVEGCPTWGKTVGKDSFSNITANEACCKYISYLLMCFDKAHTICLCGVIFKVDAMEECRKTF